MPGIGAIVLIAGLAAIVYFVYRFDRTGGTLTLFVALMVVTLLVLALLMAGLLVFASYPQG